MSAEKKVERSFYDLLKKAVSGKGRDDVVALIRELLKDAPFSVGKRVALGSVLSRVGRLDEALEELEQVAEIIEKGARVYSEIARIYLEKGDYQKVIRNLVLALAFNPHDREVWEVLEEINREAASFLRKALSSAGLAFKEPRSEEARRETGTRTGGFITETLANIYLAQGRKKEALQAFKRILEMSPENEFVKKRIQELEEELAREVRAEEEVAVPPAPAEESAEGVIEETTIKAWPEESPDVYEKAVPAGVGEELPGEPEIPGSEIIDLSEEEVTEASPEEAIAVKPPAGEVPEPLSPEEEIASLKLERTGEEEVPEIREVSEEAAGPEEPQVRAEAISEEEKILEEAERAARKVEESIAEFARERAVEVPQEAVEAEEDVEVLEVAEAPEEVVEVEPVEELEAAEEPVEVEEIEEELPTAAEVPEEQSMAELEEERSKDALTRLQNFLENIQRIKRKRSGSVVE